MTVFLKEKLVAIAAVAAKYGIPESTDKDKAGVFYDIASDLIIDTRLKSEYFSGLPAIGFYNTKTFTIEENTQPICVEIRQAINDAFAKITKPQPKTHSKSQGWKEPEAPKPEEPTSIKDAIEKDKKDHENKAEKAQDVSPPAPQVQEPEPKKTVPVIMCCVCGFEMSHAEALKQAEDGIRPKEMKHADCEGKKPAPKEGTMNEQTPKEPEKQPEPQIKPTDNILEYIRTYVNNDVLEIFGDSGTGKSKFAVEVARQTIAAGKTVFYLDTERNLSKEEVEKLKGCQYKYTPLISEISSLTRTLPKVDLVIIDSIGFPILTAYARMNMKQKGDALLNMIAIFGDLKEWAYRNNSIAIVINQPESDFNKEPGHLIRPFGDKSQFAAKEIWKTDVTQRGTVTKSTVQAFRSRSVGHKTLIASMEVSNSGTVIKGVKGNGT